MYECRLGCTICYLTINNIVGSNKKIKSSTVLQCLDFIDIVKPSSKFWKRYFNKKVRKGLKHKRGNWFEWC